ncbi:MAG TPA: amidohydrolase [Bacillota bacterium]|nr:amidohydrolase [Bacillota bacterium]
MLAIVKGKVLTMAGRVIDSGVVLVEGSTIVAVGALGEAGVAIPPETEIVDASGKIVMPGLIDAHCHVGVAEEVYREEGDDTNEMTDPVTPHLRALDGIDPADLGFQDALDGGVTTVATGPGSANVIGGQAIVMKTWGVVVDDMVVRAPAGLKVAFGENPKRVYGQQKKMPSTRMGTAALLREALVKAQHYLEKQENPDPEKRPERDLKMEILVSVLKKEIPLRAHAHRADDIATAIRIAEEFNVDLVIEHCTEGHKIGDFLAAHGKPAVVGPLLTNRSKVELKDRTAATPAILHAAGVKVALMTDHPVIPLNYLSLCAALAVKEGLPEEEALKAITINSAEILGLGHRLGSLEPGKDADIIILNGNLLDIQTRVEQVYIEGRRVR